MKWVRLYTEITRDRKLRRHNPTVRWIWVGLMCMAVNHQYGTIDAKR